MSEVENLKTIETLNREPFKYMVATIGNLPTSFVDSMSYYECIAWLVKYLETEVIPTVNNNAEAVQELQQAYIILKNYVDNYFDEHFAQDIRDKIDEMVEDGSLESIILAAIHQEMIFDTTTEMLQYESFAENNIVKTLGYAAINDNGGATFKIVSGDLTADNKSIYEVNDGLFAVFIPIGKKINVMQFGITNKDNYDSDFAWLASYINTNAIKEVEFNNETYNVTNYTVFDVTATTFKMNFNGGKIKLNSSFNYYMYGIFTINMDKTKDTKCYILNGNFDGSGNPADFSELNVHPKGGKGMFYVNGARYIKADNLYFYYWFYSEAICTDYCEKGDFTNLTGDLVGGRSADNTEDARGDALYFGHCGVVEDENNQVDAVNSHPVSINIRNCNFSSWEAIPTLYPGAGDQAGRNGSHSGRAGIVFSEYTHTNAQKVFNVEDCYFYNYQRTFHLENVENISVNIKNTVVKDYGQVLLMHGDTDTYNYINFDNCIFDKQVDVIAIYDSYQFIISAAPTTIVKGINFNNCKFYDLYNKFILYGNNVNYQFNNCDITVNKFTCNNNVYINMNKCNIKYNETSFYNSGYNLVECTGEGGYLHNASSKTYMYVSISGATLAKNNYVDKCNFLNIGFHNAIKKIKISNSTLNYDNNFVGTDNGGVARDYFVSCYGDKLESFENNVVKNTNTSMNRILDNANNGTYTVRDNVITNCRLGAVNLTGYKASFYNNKFINDSSSITGAVTDLYGCKCIWHDNQYIGYTTAMASYSSATQYNNYTSPDGTTNTLIV